MTLCAMRQGAQCCCQPDDGVLCPHVSPHDWPEDFGHENGDYLNQCIECDQLFIGYKRRVVCRKCRQEQTETPAT